ncbi:MAG: ABC transporter ATP-binding protein [Burkholderiaceae bacterium]
MFARPVKCYYREFWALRDVSFEIPRGETVGIVGRNGSGKSTLLQLICGTISPTAGSVVTHGRIGALLELGSGFNPEFTGRENVYMNAALLGLTSAEVDQRYDDIAAFADIGEFIDQPVKSYSSGMVVRLAFAVQAQVEPDILIVDEALAVGDARFQAKCFEQLKRLKNRGTSILLVSHSSEQIVTHCSQAILLDHGRQVSSGAPRDVVNVYQDLLFGKERQAAADPAKPSGPRIEASSLVHAGLSTDAERFGERPGYNPHEYRWGDGTASILDFHLVAGGKSHPSAIESGDTVLLGLAIRFHRNIVRPVLGVTIKTKEGVTVYGANSETLNCREFVDFGAAGSVLVVEVSFECRLAVGDYFISLGVAAREGEQVIPHDRRYDAIHLQVGPCPRFFGLADLDLGISAKQVSS